MRPWDTMIVPVDLEDYCNIISSIWSFEVNTYIYIFVIFDVTVTVTIKLTMKVKLIRLIVTWDLLAEKAVSGNLEGSCNVVTSIWLVDGKILSSVQGRSETPVVNL